jgi:hypothetical protein
MSFGFNPEEKWNVSTDSLLPVGNHVCEILEIEAGPDVRSRNNYPEVRLKVGNTQGTLRDWITISNEKTFGKFTALVLAVGFDQADWPQAGEDFSTEDGHVKQSYANKLLGRRVGVVAREEPDQQGSPRIRVKGYVPVGDIKASDVTSPNEGASFAHAGSRKPADDDIPF